MYFNFIILILVSTSSTLFAQEIVFENSNTHIPTGLVYLSALYDGADSIYLLGGDNTYRPSDEIFKFNVTSDSIEVVAKFPTAPLSYGSAVWGGDGSIYYFGGSSRPDIWRFDPVDNSVEEVGSLPYIDSLRGATAVSDGANSAYIFGYPNVLKFDVSNKTVELVNGHKNDLEGSAIWANGQAYIFGGAHRNTTTGDYYSNEIWRYTPTNNNMELLEVRLPLKTDMTSAVWDGTNVYIIGGYGESVNTVIIFNPVANTAIIPTVVNFPLQFFSASSAYVEKLNRIYTFGGGSQYGPKNSIVYIDL